MAAVYSSVILAPYIKGPNGFVGCEIAFIFATEKRVQSGTWTVSGIQSGGTVAGTGKAIEIMGWIKNSERDTGF